MHYIQNSVCRYLQKVAMITRPWAPVSLPPRMVSNPANFVFPQIFRSSLKLDYCIMIGDIYFESWYPERRFGRGMGTHMVQSCVACQPKNIKSQKLRKNEKCVAHKKGLKVCGYLQNCRCQLLRRDCVDFSRWVFNSNKLKLLINIRQLYINR